MNILWELRTEGVTSKSETEMSGGARQTRSWVGLLFCVCVFFVLFFGLLFVFLPCTCFVFIVKIKFLLGIKERKKKSVHLMEKQTVPSWKCELL